MSLPSQQRIFSINVQYGSNFFPINGPFNEPQFYKTEARTGRNEARMASEQGLVFGTRSVQSPILVISSASASIWNVAQSRTLACKSMIIPHGKMTPQWPLPRLLVVSHVCCPHTRKVSTSCLLIFKVCVWQVLTFIIGVHSSLSFLV